MSDDQAKDGGSKPLVDINVDASLKGIGELEGVLNNLVNSLSRGISRAYVPLGRYFDARADRAVTNQKAQLLIDLAKKRAELIEIEEKLADRPKILPGNVGERAFEQLIEETFRKQKNREATAETTISELQLSPPTHDTDKVIEEDWLTQFWGIAENISNAEVRRFLARLLAKEISGPGSISPLTLRVLSTITPHVARRFEHFCRLSIRDDNEVFVIHPNVFAFQNVGPLDMFGVSDDDLYELESYGLLRSAETIMLNFANEQSDRKIDYAGKPMKLALSGLQLHLLKLTHAGAELRDLLVLSEFPEYTEVLSAKLGNAFRTA